MQTHDHFYDINSICSNLSISKPKGLLHFCLHFLLLTLFSKAMKFRVFSVAIIIIIILLTFFLKQRNSVTFCCYCFAFFFFFPFLHNITIWKPCPIDSTYETYSYIVLCLPTLKTAISNQPSIYAFLY